MDAHWRGAIIVAKALCDAGFEVVLGHNMSPAAVVATAVQEAVDYIRISSLSGNHLVTVPRIIELLKRKRPMISRSLSAVLWWHVGKSRELEWSDILFGRRA